MISLLEQRGSDFGDWLAQDGEDPENAFGSKPPNALMATGYRLLGLRRHTDE